MKGKKIKGVLVLGLLALLASCGEVTESSGPVNSTGGSEGTSEVVSSEAASSEVASSEIPAPDSSSEPVVSTPDSEIASSTVATYAIAIEGEHITTTGPAEAKAGDEVTIEVTAEADYRITGATLNGEAVEIVDGKITFTMPDGNATIVIATAELHDIIVTAPDVVTVGGNLTGVAGEVIELTVEVDEEYHIIEITVDGEEATLADGVLTVTMGEADMTIDIKVEPINVVTGEGGIVEEW